MYEKLLFSGLNLDIESCSRWEKEFRGMDADRDVESVYNLKEVHILSGHRITSPYFTQLLEKVNQNWEDLWNYTPHHCILVKYPSYRGKMGARLSTFPLDFRFHCSLKVICDFQFCPPFKTAYQPPYIRVGTGKYRLCPSWKGAMKVSVSLFEWISLGVYQE